MHTGYTVFYGEQLTTNCFAFQVIVSYLMRHFATSDLKDRGHFGTAT